MNAVNILLQSLAQVEEHFRKNAMIAPNLLDMVGQGEKAYLFLTGTMDDGWDVTVGMFNDKARYVRFKKRTASKWTDADSRGVLMQIGHFGNWQLSGGDADYREKEGEKVLATAPGWLPPEPPRAFIYVPDFPGEVGVMPAKTGVNQKS